jgi:hypothetical protein
MNKYNNLTDLVALLSRHKKQIQRLEEEGKFSHLALVELLALSPDKEASRFAYVLGSFGGSRDEQYEKMLGRYARMGKKDLVKVLTKRRGLPCMDLQEAMWLFNKDSKRNRDKDYGYPDFSKYKKHQFLSGGSTNWRINWTKFGAIESGGNQPGTRKSKKVAGSAKQNRSSTSRSRKEQSTRNKKRTPIKVRDNAREMLLPTNLQAKVGNDQERGHEQRPEVVDLDPLKVLRGKLENSNCPVPEVGYELCSDGGEIVASAELAWPNLMVAVLLKGELPLQEQFTTRGWKIVEETAACEEPEKLVGLLTGKCEGQVSLSLDFMRMLIAAGKEEQKEILEDIEEIVDTTRSIDMSFEYVADRGNERIFKVLSGGRWKLHAIKKPGSDVYVIGGGER